jgi:hypothetical protein
VAGCCECRDEPSGSCATELVILPCLPTQARHSQPTSVSNATLLSCHVSIPQLLYRYSLIPVNLSVTLLTLVNTVLSLVHLSFTVQVFVNPRQSLSYVVNAC